MRQPFHFSFPQQCKMSATNVSNVVVAMMIMMIIVTTSIQVLLIFGQVFL